MNTPFCLSYNVNVLNSRYESQIDSFRSKIEKHLSEQDAFYNVGKDIHVDTTIIGEIEASGLNDDARKKNVKETITLAFESQDVQILLNDF